jgi:excisionase family DNA binding protein
MTIAQLDELLTTAQFARTIKQSESSVRRKVADGTIAAYRVGENGPLRIPASELQKHLRPAGRAKTAGVAASAVSASLAPERRRAAQGPPSARPAARAPGHAGRLCDVGGGDSASHSTPTPRRSRLMGASHSYGGGIEMQGKRTRALDSRGRPVPGLYVRDGRFIAGAKVDGRWTMRNLDAATLTEARRERESWLAGLREGRVAARSETTFAALFADYQAARQLSPRTIEHERHLLDRHLATFKTRRAQDISASDVARRLRDLRSTYSPWTCVAVYRLLAGTFALGVRRGILTRNPVDGLAPAERPKQRNAKRVAVLDASALARFVKAGTTERWRAALALAAYAGLRLGEIRAVTWTDVDLKANTIEVRRSLLPDGTAKEPKTDAGKRTIPMLPALRRELLVWKVKAPHKRPDDLVIGTADEKPVEERNLRRAFQDAKDAAQIDVGEARLSWHALRHSAASMLATELELPATTLAAVIGHADAGFTLRVYARDGRDPAAVVRDVLDRAAAAGVGQ